MAQRGQATKQAQAPAPAASSSVTVTMAHDKETKGTHRYREIDPQSGQTLDQDYAIGTLYVRKTALDSTAPDRIRVAISW